MPLAPRLVGQVIARCESSLETYGKLIVESGHFTDDKITVSLHTDIGPSTTSKNTNQDFALGWMAHPHYRSTLPHFVIAAADGLSSSRGAEWGAMTVCFQAVSWLIENYRYGLDPEELSATAFRVAENSLTMMADSMGNRPHSSCPVSDFSRTWEHILKKRQLLQTTLMLCWCDGAHFHTAAIGDGGIVLFPNGDKAAGETISECDLTTSVVNYLGPRPPSSGTSPALDIYENKAVGPLFSGLICTDGIARGMQNDLLGLSEILELPKLPENETAPRDFITSAKDEMGNSFDDNLTLAMFRVSTNGN